MRIAWAFYIASENKTANKKQKTKKNYHFYWPEVNMYKVNSYIFDPLPLLWGDVVYGCPLSEIIMKNVSSWNNLALIVLVLHKIIKVRKSKRDIVLTTWSVLLKNENLHRHSSSGLLEKVELIRAKKYLLFAK